MSTWTSAPPTSGAAQAFRITRTKANTPLRFICVSNEVVGTNLHYWKGRSRPCEGNECEACKTGNLPRWRGYLEGLNQTGNVVIIVEITERCFPALEEAMREHGSLRGLGIELARINGRANGPLEATIKGVMRSDGQLPPENDLCAILDRMWEVNRGTIEDFRKIADEEQIVRIAK